MHVTVSRMMDDNTQRNAWSLPLIPASFDVLHTHTHTHTQAHTHTRTHVSYSEIGTPVCHRGYRGDGCESPAESGRSLPHITPEACNPFLHCSDCDCTGPGENLAFPLLSLPPPPPPLSIEAQAQAGRTVPRYGDERNARGLLKRDNVCGGGGDVLICRV